MRSLLPGLLVLFLHGGVACVGTAEEATVGLGLEAAVSGDAGVADAGVVDAGASPAVDVCAGVGCGHGQCDPSSGKAACRCDTGFHPAAGTCVVDDPCAGVTCGPNATCKGGPCACNDGFAGDPVTGCINARAAQEDTTRAQLVSIATAELGKCEGTTPRPYMQGQPGLWCYDFVAWVYTQATYSLPTPLSLPVYHPGALPPGWHPKPGDLIKYTYQHYGMVESVSADGRNITTLEGNVASCVTRRATAVSALELIGSLDAAF